MKKFADLSSKLAVTLKTADRQSRRFHAVETADNAFVSEFEKLFSGQKILKNPEKIQAVTRLSNVLREGQARQLDTALFMGRALRDVEKLLKTDEFETLLEGSSKLFQISKSTATMYRLIATYIDDGIIPREICPNSVSTVYQLTTCPPELLKNLVASQLITPKLTRTEAIKLKKTWQASEEPPLDICEKLYSQKKQLLDERARHENRIYEIEQLIEGLDKKITDLNQTEIDFFLSNDKK